MVVDDVVVVGIVGCGRVVVVVGFAVVVVLGGSGAVSVGACSLNGTGAFGPPTTYTGVPFGTAPGNQLAVDIGIRTQPCEAGPAGTEGEPWMAIPPLK